MILTIYYILILIYFPSRLCLESDMKVAWLSETSMKLTLDDEDLMINVEPVDVPGEIIDCLFTGGLDKDSSSSVTVSGCRDSNHSLLSISSKLVPGGVLSLGVSNGVVAILNMTTDGNVDTIQVPSNELHVRSKRDTGIKYPAEVELKTDVWYDSSLLNKFDGSHERTKGWLTEVIFHTKTFFVNPTLEVKVVLIPGEKQYFNVKPLRADGVDINRLAVENLNPKANKTVLNSYFCYDVDCTSEACLQGVSFGSAACNKDGYAVNINEYYSENNTVFKTAIIFTHEVGHNLGML